MLISEISNSAGQLGDGFIIVGEFFKKTSDGSVQQVT